MKFCLIQNFVLCITSHLRTQLIDWLDWLVSDVYEADARQTQNHYRASTVKKQA